MTRPSTAEIMLRFAELLSERSTCARLSVGAVVTDYSMLYVLGIGYNGNAKGLPNGCDSTTPGACGCLHAEINALLKAPGAEPAKILFTSHAPCLACAKAILNSNVVKVVFRTHYRQLAGAELLRTAGIVVERI
jgi:dCMP deaminase